jgi:hypothetical protein
MSTALDRRAEAAAAAVRAAVAHLEPVPGARPAPPRRRWPVLVAAVALVAAAIGGAVVVEGDDGDDVVAGPSGAIPRLVAGDLPAGVAPAGATELPVPGASSSTFRLYGRGDADDPFADGDVGVVIYRDVGPFTAPGKDVEVRGARGSLAEDASYGRSLTWHEAGVGSIGLQSRSMEEAQLHAVAEGLRRKGDDLVVDRPPDGYRLVADLRGLPGIATDAMAPGDRGSAVQYQSDHGDRSLTVTVVVDRPGALEAVRWLGGKGARSTSVRGHDGWLLPISAEEAQLPISALGWREQPGVLVTVSGLGVTERELRAAAESLRPATESEWAELLHSGEDVVSWDEDMPTLADGTGWRYARDGNEGVCFEALDPMGSTGTCYRDPPRLSEGAEQTEDGWWFHGRVTDEVVRVSLQQEGGAPQQVDTVPLEGRGRAWAALLPEAGSTTITALDAGGAEVDRTTADVGAGRAEATTTTSP